MESKTVTVQAVVAAIRATKGIRASAKYPSSARRTRSIGVYTEKRHYDGSVILGYCTNGYKHVTEGPQEIAAVIATLETRGFVVVEVEEKSWLGTEKVLIVKAAA